MFSRLAHALLAATLLLCLQAALLHPLQHVDAQGVWVHVPGKDKAPGKLCGALDALTGCVPDAPSRLFVFEAFECPPAYSRGAPRLAEAPPFLSQGPPSLL